jgi:hypothetical protein
MMFESKHSVYAGQCACPVSYLIWSSVWLLFLFSLGHKHILKERFVMNINEIPNTCYTELEIHS